MIWAVICTHSVSLDASATTVPYAFVSCSSTFGLSACMLVSLDGLAITGVSCFLWSSTVLAVYNRN